MKFRIALLITFCFVPLFSFAETETFPRILRTGMRGGDVREMQKALNRDTETRIAETGPGSPGRETDYFGPATKRALIKFQEKYRDEILKPIGLVRGTGVFGGKTQAKVKKLLSDVGLKKPAAPSEEIVATTTTAAVPIEKKDVYVKYPSQYSGKPGTTITILGFGFTPTNNTVYFGNTYTIEKATSSDEQSLAIIVPDIPKGVYTLFVKNARGDSKSSSFFAVTDGVTPAPSIESITPSHAAPGDTITIKGSGFSKTGNMLRTSMKVFENIPSGDGTTLSFVSPGTIFPSREKLPFAYWVYVVNERGVSSGKSFILDL